MVKRIPDWNKVNAQMTIDFYYFCNHTKTIAGNATYELTSKERRKVNQESVTKSTNSKHQMQLVLLWVTHLFKKKIWDLSSIWMAWKVKLNFHEFTLKRRQDNGMNITKTQSYDHFI